MLAVEVHADQRPVEARGHLFDVRGFARAVVARNHHAAIVGEAGEDGERGVAVEQVVRIEVRHILVRLGIGGHLDVAVDAEHLPDGESSCPAAAPASIED